MHIKSLFVFIVMFFMLGCGLNITPPVAIPVAIPVAESGQPTLKKVGISLNDSVTSNEMLQEKLKEQVDVVSNQNREIKEALTQAENIRAKVLAKQAVTELDTLNLVEEIKKIQQRNMFLEKNNSDLLKIKDGQLASLNQASEDIIELQHLISAKDTEALNLRTYSEFLKTNLAQKNDEVVGLQKALENEKIHSSKSDVYRNWIFGLVGSFGLWLVVKNVLMSMNPLTRFRI